MANVLPAKRVEDDGGGNGLDAGELRGRPGTRLVRSFGDADGKRQNDAARVDFFSDARWFRTPVPPSDLDHLLAETDLSPYFLREPFDEPAHSAGEREKDRLFAAHSFRGHSPVKLLCSLEREQVRNRRSIDSREASPQWMPARSGSRRARGIPLQIGGGRTKPRIPRPPFASGIHRPTTSGLFRGS
jgi:hypothetical protein